MILCQKYEASIVVISGDYYDDDDGFENIAKNTTQGEKCCSNGFGEDFFDIEWKNAATNLRPNELK